MAAHTDAAAYFFSRSVLCFLTFSICICVGVFSYCMLSRSYLQSSGTSEQTQGQLLQQGNIDWLPPSGKLPPAFWGAIIICAIIIRLILYLFIKSFLFCLRISYTFLKKSTLKSTVFCSICTRYDCAIDISVQLYTQAP